MRVLMLAPWMKMGHGVSEMVACLAPELEKLGIETSVGCLDHDKHFKELDIRRVQPDPRAISLLAGDIGAEAVVALGTPFFEVLPHLDGGMRTVAYEAGDPTPELFGPEAAERRAIVENKRSHVYPYVDSVAAISHFIKSEIGWPATAVVVLGVDNVPDRGSRPLSPPRPPGPLRVGALTRLGVGEAKYKGGAEILELKEELDALGVECTFELMGRGTPDDARAFAAQGFRVHLNASEAERNAYLRDLDVFVTTSLWEGTNLPLVEAQALGTPGLALDTGAHPEFTPLLFRSTREMALQIQAYAADRHGLLISHGLVSYRFVRSRMVWRETALKMQGLVEGVRSVERGEQTLPVFAATRRSVVRSLRHEGAVATLRKVQRAVGRRS